MSSIRWRPRNVVMPTSREVKKSFQVYRFGRSVNVNCFCFKRTFNLLDGGTPSAGGPKIYDGGTPSAGGPKKYDGGTLSGGGHKIYDGGSPSVSGNIKDGGTPSAGGSENYNGGKP